MPSRSNRRSGGSRSDNTSHSDIGYNRGSQSGGVSGGYNHGHSNAGSKRASRNHSNYQKSNYQKSNNPPRKSTRIEKYHGKTKPRATISKIDSPPEEILLIGDSMLRNIDPDAYKQAVWLFSYPGINASQVRFLKIPQFQSNFGYRIVKIKN